MRFAAKKIVFVTMAILIIIEKRQNVDNSHEIFRTSKIITKVTLFHDSYLETKKWQNRFIKMMIK